MAEMHNNLDHDAPGLPARGRVGQNCQIFNNKGRRVNR
jgi:hypothetical protein